MTYFNSKFTPQWISFSFPSFSFPPPPPTPRSSSSDHELVSESILRLSMLSMRIVSVSGSTVTLDVYSSDKNGGFPTTSLP